MKISPIRTKITFFNEKAAILTAILDFSKVRICEVNPLLCIRREMDLSRNKSATNENNIF